MMGSQITFDRPRSCLMFWHVWYQLIAHVLTQNALAARSLQPPAIASHISNMIRILSCHSWLLC